MKVLLILLSFILISCGGSSSGGGGNGGNDGCVTNKCMKDPYSPRKPSASKRPISRNEVEKMIQKNIKVFENIPVGLNFTEAQACKSTTQGGMDSQLIYDMTVLKVDLSNRNIIYRVKVLAAPDDGNGCLYNPYKGEKEFVLTRELPTVDQIFDDLKQFKDFYLTSMDGTPFVLAFSDETDSDGWRTKTELGIHMGKSYPLSAYVDTDLYYSGQHVLDFINSVKESGMVDSSTIDTSNLPNHYERHNQ